MLLPKVNAVQAVVLNEGVLCKAGCGVVPTKYAHQATWDSGAGGYGADGVYFGTLARLLPRTYMFNKVRPCH